MKRKIVLISLSLLFSLSFNIVNASDSATVSGGGFTLYGSISDNTLSGSATGTYASQTTVSVWGYVYNADGSTSYASKNYGTPYVSSSYKSYGTYPIKWQSGWAKGELKNSNSVQTRKMIN